jgi:hypothetical protein
MSSHIKYVCEYLEQELCSLRGSDFDEAVRIIEQSTRNSERHRKSQESYDKIFRKLDRCSDDYAKIDMYHNQKFERSIGLLWKPEAPARRLLELLKIAALMFVCSNMVANELETFAAFKPVQTTADLLNEKYGQLPIPEVVWKKAKNRLELPQIVLLDARAKDEALSCLPSRRQRQHSAGPSRDQSPARPPPAKRAKMSPSSSLSSDEVTYHPAQDDCTPTFFSFFFPFPFSLFPFPNSNLPRRFPLLWGTSFSLTADALKADAHYTPLSKVTAVEFMLTYRKWPELVYLISPKNYGILPSLEMDPDMYATLIERAKAIAHRDEGNDAAVQSLEGQTYVVA